MEFPADLVVAAITFFVLGFSLGYIFGRQFHEDQVENLRTKVAVIVTLVWAFAVVSAVFIDGQTVSIWLHAIMGGIVGYLFGTENPIFNVGNGPPNGGRP